MRIIKNFSIYAGIDVIGAFIGLATSPITTRLLTEKQYGTIPLIGSIWAIVMILRYGGMNWSYLFFRVRKGLDQNVVLTTATVTATISSLIAVSGFVAIALLTPLIRDFVAISRLELCLYLIGLMPAALVDWYLYLLRFLHQARSFARIAIMQRIISVFFAIPIMFFVEQSLRLAVLIGTTSFVSFIALCIALSELHKLGKWPYKRSAFNPPMMQEMLKFGLVMIPGGVAYAFVAVTDRLLVGGIKGPAEVAILALAGSLGMIVVKMKKWIELTFNPYLTEWLAENDPPVYKEKLDTAISLFTFVFVPLTGLIAVWSQPLVFLLYPSSYAKAGLLVPIIAFSGMLSLFSMVAIATLIIQPSKHLPLTINCGALAVNVAIGIVLIPTHGALGAVIGTVVAEGMILLSWIACGSKLYRNLLLNWGPAFWGSGVVLCMILLCHFYLAGSGMILSRVGISSAILVCMVICLYVYPPLGKLKGEVLAFIKLRVGMRT